MAKKTVAISVDGNEPIEIPFHEFLYLLTNASIGANDAFKRTFRKWKEDYIGGDGDEYKFFLNLTREVGDGNEITNSLENLKLNMMHSHDIVENVRLIEEHLKK